MRICNKRNECGMGCKHSSPHMPDVMQDSTEGNLQMCTEVGSCLATGEEATCVPVYVAQGYTLIGLDRKDAVEAARHLFLAARQKEAYCSTVSALRLELLFMDKYKVEVDPNIERALVFTLQPGPYALDDGEGEKVCL